METELSESDMIELEIRPLKHQSNSAAYHRRGLEWN